MDGEGSDFPFPSSEIAWSDRIIAALEEAGDDPSVGAVVLRVNSPGGSVLASDRIARVLLRLRKSGQAGAGLAGRRGSIRGVLRGCTGE
jgi:protease-4